MAAKRISSVSHLGRLGGLFAVVLGGWASGPVLAQSLEEPEFSYVMTMQFYGCSMTEAELSEELQALGIDREAQDAKTQELVDRGDATVTDEGDGTRRISMLEHACEPVEFGEWEVGTKPLSEEEEKAKYQQDVFVGVMAARDCTMTKAEIAAEMPLYGLDLVQEALVERLVGAGSASLTDEADGAQRLTLAPEICTPGQPAVQLLPAKPESVAKFTEYLLARNCAVEIPKMEEIEAELGFEQAESSHVTMVMEVRGDAKLDFENGLIRLINKDCP